MERLSNGSLKKSLWLKFLSLLSFLLTAAEDAGCLHIHLAGAEAVLLRARVLQVHGDQERRGDVDEEDRGDEAERSVGSRVGVHERIAASVRKRREALRHLYFVCMYVCERGRKECE